jgi:SAM-dependent methyltransferase
MKTTDFKDKKLIKKYQKKTLGSIFIYTPALFGLLKNIKGKTILDLGCGSGYIAKELGRKGAKVFAIDNSKEWIKLCEEENKNSKNVKCLLVDATNLSVFKKKKFDIIIANMVFLNISSKNLLEKIFKEISMVLKKNGIFIFSDWHPVSIMISNLKTRRKTNLLPNFSYFKEGSKLETKALLSDYSYIEFLDSHYSLEFYSKLLSKNKMMIEEIIEPKPIKLDKKKVLKNYTIPEYIIFKCRKI